MFVLWIRQEQKFCFYYSKIKFFSEVLRLLKHTLNNLDILTNSKFVQSIRKALYDCSQILAYTLAKCSGAAMTLPTFGSPDEQDK